MSKIAALPVEEIEALVLEIGTLPAAPLAMPKQMLETAEPLTLRRLVRAVLALLQIGPAPRREM